jgi:Putative zinc dependent peptidase (DUF5700)
MKPLRLISRAAISLVSGLLISTICGPVIRAQTKPPLKALNVRIITDEADAVLAILAKRQTETKIGDADWQRLFTSEAYVRLKKREAAMKRSFEDEQFKNFVLSDQLLTRATLLSDTLEKWRHADLTGAARRSLRYLPPEARISAKIYPVIKPVTNSFVFEVKEDPAIFLYLDPEVTKAQFENTLAHELHHIGYANSCGAERANVVGQLPPNVRSVFDWISAFGEGFAMLAAAGGPNTHPHKFSKPEDRARWDHDVLNFNSDLRTVEGFFTDILDNKLTEEQRQTTGYSFFGVQGPWYTVGWKMSVTIERAFGRKKLLECICDHRKLLTTYNQAAMKFNRRAKEPLALWSPELLKGISVDR